MAFWRKDIWAENILEARRWECLVPSEWKGLDTGVSFHFRPGASSPAMFRMVSSQRKVTASPRLG